MISRDLTRGGVAWSDENVIDERRERDMPAIMSRKYESASSPKVKLPTVRYRCTVPSAFSGYINPSTGTHLPPYTPNLNHAWGHAAHKDRRGTES